MITVHAKNVNTLVKGGVITRADIEAGDARTANGAESYPTTGNILVDFFTKVTRGMPTQYLHYLLNEAYNESPVDAIVLLFQARDCRGGKGEKDLFREGMRWLMAKDPNVALAVLELIPEYGSYKEWLHIFAGTEFEGEMVRCFATQLRKDKALLLASEAGKMSLAVKYAPKEGRSWDKRFRLASKLARELGFKNNAQLRKVFLAPLNAAVHPVEVDMCAGAWENVDFSKVPSRAMHIYRKAWLKRQECRFQEFLQRAKKGEVKMNTGQLQPHEIVLPYTSGLGYHGRNVTEDDMVEAQWSQFITLQRERFAALDIPFPSGISLVDVSGSMTCPVGGTSTARCLDVSIALGLFVAEMTPGRFHNKTITFFD